MQTAKLFQNGRSQAVRLPKDCQFPGTDVLVQRVGDSVILFPSDKRWETFLHGLNGFSRDFMEQGRQQPAEQKRKGL